MKKHFFKKFAYEFETTRVLWYAPTGGSDYAEVKSIAEKITHETYEEWFQAWNTAATNLYQNSQRTTSPIRKGKMLLRASRYFQAAEFFLHPSDERKLESYELSVSTFYKGLDLLQVPYEIRTLDFQGPPLRTVYFKPKTFPIKGTFFVCGGFDALLEELYFTTAAAALDEGYQVILFEGPGQSHMIRYYNFPFTPNWEEVCHCVIHAYEQQNQIIGPKIGLGLSLGGLLIARAASKDATLFDKIVLQNYFPSVIDSLKQSMPTFLHRFVDNGFPNWMLPLCDTYIHHQHFLNWQVEHAKWVFGKNHLNDLLKVCQKFNEPENLTNDCLLFVAEDENYYPPQQGRELYD